MIEEARERGAREIGLCAFCRKPASRSYEEEVKRTKKLMEANNANAFYDFAGMYCDGIKGMHQNYEKANELFLRAGELGCAAGFYDLGNSYNFGRGVDIDKKKAKHFYELAAMGGDVDARYNLGMIEGKAGNSLRAKKHLILSANAGHKGSLDWMKNGYKYGIVTKDDYANALRAYQQLHDEMKSKDRDRAVARGVARGL